MTRTEPTGAAVALLDATMQELDERGYAGVSLRAVARRAGVSHAAPKYFYRDRAGLMSAAATVGFTELASRVRSAVATGTTALADAGYAYLAFSLARPALFDLMFRPSELDNADGPLNAARGDALSALNEIVDPEAAERGEVSDPTLSCWAFAHGIAVLLRDGALAEATDGSEPAEDIARRLISEFGTPGVDR